MSAIYRKWGRSIRREGQYLISVDEAGEAIEDRELFRTQTTQEGIDLPAPDADAVDGAAREIESMIEPPLMIERMLISEGVIAHRYGDTSWNETLRRVHLSIARPPFRILLDLAEFRFDVIRRMASALARAVGERKPPKRIRLAAHVGSPLLQFAPVEKFQSAIGRDGKGQPVEERRCSGGEPPNWFRPSYRVRPRRAWLHLRMESFGAIDDDIPEAVALIAPPSRREIRVLCVDGKVAYPTAIPMRTILAGEATGTWYPYGAGAFGAKVML